MENATSFTSPLATVKYGAVNVPWQLDYVVDAVSNASGWQIALTILALLVVYDQCMSFSSPHGAQEKNTGGRPSGRDTDLDGYQTPISRTRARSWGR